MTQGACDQGAEGHALSQLFARSGRHRWSSFIALLGCLRWIAVAERRSGSASFGLRGEPFHRAGGVHGLSGLQFAALLGGLCEPAEQLKDVVVMNSCTALRWAASRVRKIWPYHGLIMMLRQSRASLSARSWAGRKQPTPDSSSARRPLDRNDLMFMVCSIGI